MRTTGFRQLIKLLKQARRLNYQQSGLAAPAIYNGHSIPRRRFIKNAATLSVAGVALAKAPGFIGTAKATESQPSPRVAIIGGGLAGLNAAYCLQKQGIKAHVFEASKRFGGRVFTRKSKLDSELALEYGAEFINSDHEDMLALVDEFGLELFDRSMDADGNPSPNTAYFFDGKSWSEAEIAELLQPLAEQIAQDAELLDVDWETYAPEFDRLSVKAYLDNHQHLIPKPFIRTLIENTIRTEYGAEPSQSSALQLLFILPTVDGEAVELLSYSDEIYTVKGGNDQIVKGLTQALGDQLHSKYRLKELVQRGEDSYQLWFSNGEKVEADYVILAMPFNALRRVKLRTSLPLGLRRMIRRVSLGLNEKLFAGFKQRVWRQSDQFDLDAWTDFGCSSIWDATQRQPELEQGALNYFLGGKEVFKLNKFRKGSAKALGTYFNRQLGEFLPTLEEAATKRFARTNWSRNPFIGGGYVNYPPGALDRFADYFWIEDDDPEERQSVVFGKLIFAGEQFSDAFYGFMEGGAQTGRLAADFLLEELQQTTAEAVTSVKG